MEILFVFGILLAVVIGVVIGATRLFTSRASTTRAPGDTAQEGGSEPVRKPGGRRDTLTPRLAVISLLALSMLIPLSLVDGIVSERGERYREVLADIAANWGQEQTLVGPILVVPYSEKVVVEEVVAGIDGVRRNTSKTVLRQRTAQFLPDDLAIDATLENAFRSRGIFRSLVYQADVSIDARFSAPRLDGLSESIENVHWDRAWVAIGLGDTRSISDIADFTWNEQTRELASGTRLDALPVGIHATLPELEQNSAARLSFTLSINGTGAFRFAPTGRETRATVRSPWPHPSFQGSALPDERRIDESGFEAYWKIPHLARSYPQRWSSVDSGVDVYGFITGVSLFEPVSLYSQIDRSVKYGVLFVALTFLTLVVFEMGIGTTLHFIQYALVGVALCLFYLILLSLSEHISFLLAYLLAASAMIVMIAFYTAALLQNYRRSGFVALLLAGLYALLYSLLQLEDYALLLGTAFLVLIVLVLMRLTRNLHRTVERDPL